MAEMLLNGRIRILEREGRSGDRVNQFKGWRKHNLSFAGKESLLQIQTGSGLARAMMTRLGGVGAVMIRAGGFGVTMGNLGVRGLACGRTDLSAKNQRGQPDKQRRCRN